MIHRGPIAVTDIHSEVYRTTVHTVHVPERTEDICGIVRDCNQTGASISVCGNRHAMGGQQFLTGQHLIDMRGMRACVHYDTQKKTATFQAGANWQDVLRALRLHFAPDGQGLSFRQKQTGADNLSLGGAVAVNAHGRGLTFPPFVADIESLLVIDAQGQLLRCSRTQHAELFSLVVGGYGLFGIVTEVELRLQHRTKVQRIVEIIEAGALMHKVYERIAAGFAYGDFQFVIDDAHPMFLQQGVFSCYVPVDISTPIAPNQAELSPTDWYRLLSLAHTDKTGAFEQYRAHYMKTDGQVYWSDEHQMSTYLDGYHIRFDAERRSPVKGSEMITELYVPREHIAAFLATAAVQLRRLHANVIYGTVRFIEPDTESVLTWARAQWACIIFNLHIDHTPEGMDIAKIQFQTLIDIAISFGGSYFLTYHHWATRAQIVACHPRIHEFLEKKAQYDPKGRFRNDWYDTLMEKLAPL
jgi:FAD/FMN-containing dehydrogenase